MPDSPYEIGSGLSEDELKLASWWVRHENLLRRALFIGLSSLAAILWLLALWGLLDIYILSAARIRSIPSHIVKTQFSPKAMQALGPQAIQPSQTVSFTLPDGRRDFLVQLYNPNERWWAEFAYAFRTSDGIETPERKGFVLPASVRSVVEAGWTSSSTAPADLVVKNVAWHRVDPRETGSDVGGFLTNRLQLTAEQPTYRDGTSSFTLRNPTPYGFWNVGMILKLYRGDTLKTISVLQELNLAPGESRPITVTWPDKPTDITKMEVEFSVNVLDKGAYMTSF